MGKLVTIGIPVYKRLEYLPNVLNVVARQDYPDIELLVSDNGLNGTTAFEIVKRCYSRPFTFRQNGSTAGLSRHFNQIVHAASGEYFVMLQDDDEISPNYVSKLVEQLERHPESSVAISKQEIIDPSGVKIRESASAFPESVRGPVFIAEVWQSHRYRFENLTTLLARTEQIKSCGGYPEFRMGSHNDNALLIKLALNSSVTFNSECAFRYRVYETSHGMSITIWDLAADTRQFLRFLQSDPVIREFAARQPIEWKQLKRILTKMAWVTYFNRWIGIYRPRLNAHQWMAAGFALPPIPAYYKGVALALAAELKRILRSMGVGVRVQ